MLLYRGDTELRSEALPDYEDNNIAKFRKVNIKKHFNLGESENK